jgi:alkylation response protein AidB-like acyl-CoA dehydrogenase
MALGEGPKSAAAAAWLPQLAEGSVAAALAYEPDGRAGLRWWLEEGRIRLEGRAGQVIEGAAAGLLVVAARGEAGTLLVALTPDHEGVEVVNRPTMDRTRNLAMLEVNTSVTEEAVIVGAEGGAAALARVLQRGAILLAAEALGGAQRCMDIAVEYAKVRVQFGRPIGSFQSIAHKCADMLVKVESARSAVLYAAWAADSGGDDLLSVSSLAKSYAAEAYYRVAGSMIQVMGGIGFTWEHEAHLHFKRARASQQLLGSTEHHREQLAAMLLDEA